MEDMAGTSSLYAFFLTPLWVMVVVQVLFQLLKSNQLLQVVKEWIISFIIIIMTSIKPEDRNSDVFLFRSWLHRLPFWKGEILMSDPQIHTRCVKAAVRFLFWPSRCINPHQERLRRRMALCRNERPSPPPSTTTRGNFSCFFEFYYKL